MNDKCKLVPVRYLADNHRFKMAFDGEGSAACFGHFREELDGRWVALVAAEDDVHLGLAHPAPSGRLLNVVDEIIPLLQKAIFARHIGDIDQNGLMEATINLRAALATVKP